MSPSWSPEVSTPQGMGWERGGQQSRETSDCWVSAEKCTKGSAGQEFKKLPAGPEDRLGLSPLLPFLLCPPAWPVDPTPWGPWSRSYSHFLKAAALAQVPLALWPVTRPQPW